MAVNAESIRARVLSLIDLLSDIEQLKEDDNRGTIENAFMGSVGVMEMLYGATSPQVRTLQDGKKSALSSQYGASYQMYLLAHTIKGSLQNVLQELEAGLVTSLANQAAGEVLGDMLALAKNAHQAGHKTVAAVLACAALEDSLKRKAEERGINTSGKSLDQVVNALKAASFFKGPQAAIVGSYVKLRNSAMHADWEKIQEADVGSLIGFLEPFLIQNFT